MPGELQVSIQPATELGAEEQVKERLFARVIYSRHLKSAEEEARETALAPVESSLVVELDPKARAGVEIKDRVPKTAVLVRIETAQGAQLWNSDRFLEGDEEASSLKVNVPSETFKSLGARIEPLVTPRLMRAGRFIRLDNQLLQLLNTRLFVAPMRPSMIGEEVNPQIAAARSVLDLEGEGDLDEFEAITLASTTDASIFNAVGFREATVRTDGSFDFSLEIHGDEIGWMWMLVGPDAYAGHQVDHVPSEPRRGVVVVLPPRNADAGSPGGHGHEGAETSPAIPPLDFDEQQLIDNPMQFGDDPGRNCSPFENPQRILGERRFFTVLRVDQPEIGAESSLVISPPIILDVAPPIRSRALVKEFSRSDADTGNIAGTSDMLSRTVRLAAVSEAIAEPASRVREFVETNIGSVVRNKWRRWVRTRLRERVPVSSRNPIEWDGDPTIYQATSVVGGHVLEWRVQWRSNGYSLGDVAHTLTLAPRQARRISKVSWRRRERAVRREITEARDQVSQTTLRDRDYNDVVQSNLSEWSKGGSESSTTGVAGGIGFAMGPVVIGGGAAHGSSSSSSWQEGGRRVAASEEQSLRDAIRQFGESLRRMESTIVTEVQQEEEVEGVSEVVRNVNYAHALTILYHEILRHYRVDTGFAGLRECLFVPFSITPFDVQKALKWRDKLRQGMLARHLRWALDQLDEVASAWVDSDIPAGRRSQHKINYVSGSLYVRLSLERPRDRNAEETEEAYRQLWTRLSPILGVSVSTILQQLKQQQIDAEAYFQREVAPVMAAKWADRLRVRVGGEVLQEADFTLASQYRYGGTVRIDFTAAVDKRYSREDLQTLTVQAIDALPAGSVANLTRLSLRYFTDHFEQVAESGRASNDLNKVDTGDADPQGALAILPLTPWELQDLRRVIEDAVDELIVHLNSNLVYYTNLIMALFDRNELYILLDGFTAPYGRRFENGAWVEDKGRSIASVVEREPIGILGNCLVFRVAAGVFLGIGDHQSPEAAHDYYYDSQYRSLPLRVSLPTDGLYAQAIMDNCVACEEHFGSIDWVLSDTDPELESLAGQLGSRRASPEGMTPTPLPDTIISLQNAPAAPDPTGLGSILQAVTKSDAFRDMAGLAGTQANAMGALNAAAGLAQGFGQMAVDFQKSKQATADAKHKLSNIQKAKDSGLIDEAEAKSQAAKALSEQNMTAEGDPLTKEPPLNDGLQNASRFGVPVEVTRQSPRGTETVKIGRSLGDVQLASLSEGGAAGPKGPKKFPSGQPGDNKWKDAVPIAKRDPAVCPSGTKDRGTLLFIHDPEKKTGFDGFGSYTDATAWMKVTTVSDLIEALRWYVGACGCVSGIHIAGHGSSYSAGGFRMGPDDNKDGHIDGGEGRDKVETVEEARLFGEIIREALCFGGRAFISISGCYTSGANDEFIKALHSATGAIIVASPGYCYHGGDWWNDAWWEAPKGRHQVNLDGTVKTDSRKEGSGIWRPF
jgi:hypothetical protein